MGMLSLSPKMPEINLSDAYSLIAHQYQSDRWAGMKLVKICSSIVSRKNLETALQSTRRTIEPVGKKLLMHKRIKIV